MSKRRVKCRFMSGIFSSRYGDILVEIWREREGGNHFIEASGGGHHMAWTIKSGRRTRFTSGLLSDGARWLIEDKLDPQEGKPVNPFILFGLALQAAPLWFWLALWALFLGIVRWRGRT